jgi:hypothetical protein
VVLKTIAVVVEVVLERKTTLIMEETLVSVAALMAAMEAVDKIAVWL